MYNAHYLLYLVECASGELSHLNPMKREVSEPLQETGSYLTYRDPIHLTIKYEMKYLKMTAYTKWRRERERERERTIAQMNMYIFLIFTLQCSHNLPHNSAYTNVL